MKRHVIPRCFIALFFTVIQAAAQAPNCAPPVALPVSTEPNIFSEEQEVYLGNAMAEHIQRDYHVIEDPAVILYLTRIGERLSKHLPLNQIRFQFFLVDMPDANAFVMPGGRIYVSRKLVAAAQTEDELASVMGHEMGHLVAHQSAIDTTRLLREVLGVTSLGDRKDVFDKYNQLLENYRRKRAAFKVEDREKGQLTADQAGLFAVVSAGYDPAAMARFWDRVNETKGKTGNWFSDLFGSTRPEQRRLREMIKVAEAVPPACRQTAAAQQSEDFKRWQSLVIAYIGSGRREALHGGVSKLSLTPPLHSDIAHLRFSPDGRYLIAQDDSGINLLTREPFAPLFRIEVPDDAYFATFTPNSQEIVFFTENLHVERWNIAEQKQIDAREVVIRKGCLQTRLSPDGKLLACLGPDTDLSLINVETSEVVWHKKDFYVPTYAQYLGILAELYARKTDTTDFNLGLINMRFSPDGRYFVAGFHGPRALGDIVEAIDINTLAKITIPGSVKKLIAAGFIFSAPDRLIGINPDNVKKSAVVTFPSGEVLSELELWRKGMIAATRGDYLLIRPIKDYPLGVMDLKTKTISKVNERSALDIYDPYFVAEMRNGQIGLYRMEKNELVATAVLSDAGLGRLRVAEVSPDMKWLALSGRSRGGIWNLAKGEAVLALRGFQGGYLSEDGYFYGDFPKYEEAERNVAKFNLESGEILPGPKIEGRPSFQFGEYLFTTRSAKATTKQQDFEAGDKPATPTYVDYRHNVMIEMFDARTMKSLWTRTYPKEAPSVWIAAGRGTVTLVWNATAESATAEIKSDPQLAQRQLSMKEKEGGYLLKILDARDGTEIGKLVIETGQGSFRLTSVLAAGDWVIITDTQNRVLVYGLKTGEQKGRVFGNQATVSLANHLLCVENEKGKLAVYDLNSLEKRDESVFARAISMLRFSPDGRRLLVLTVDQTVYQLDVSALNNTVTKQ